MAILLFGLGGFIVAYVTQAALLYDPQSNPSGRQIISLLCGALAAWGATSSFRNNSKGIALASFVLLIAHIFSNMVIQYCLTYDISLWSITAFWFTLPLGVVWFSLIRHHVSKNPDRNFAFKFSAKETFQKPITRIVGILLLLICSFLFFYRLGYFDIWEDENLVINAAKGVYEQGFGYLKEGYSRAWVHTVLCAGVFKVAGISELTGRFPSAVFGVLFVLVCYLLFSRWYGLAWLALFIPVICIMNDRFLILFRYMRMYALLIPLFVTGVYILYRTVNHLWPPKEVDTVLIPDKKKWILVALSGVFLLLLAHLHKLSMILLPVFGLYVAYLTIVQRNKKQVKFLLGAAGLLVVVLFLAFVVKIDTLKLFPQALTRITTPHRPFPDYFEYMLGNALPTNSTVMVLVAGLGLVGPGVARPVRSVLMLTYLFITLALIAMVYLIANEGRDYRYVAHMIPFVVGAVLYISYRMGNVLWQKSYPWSIVLIFGIAAFQLVDQYKKVYVRHPWAPFYSKVYSSLVERYQPGDALFSHVIKTYYLDPVELAGEHYYKVPRRKEYTMDQFMTDLRKEGHGWITWEVHKAHHWKPEIVEYVYRNFKHIHGGNIDDLGVELFYFDESMIR